MQPGWSWPKMVLVGAVLLGVGWYLLAFGTCTSRCSSVARCIEWGERVDRAMSRGMAGAYFHVRTPSEVMAECRGEKRTCTTRCAINPTDKMPWWGGF